MLPVDKLDGEDVELEFFLVPGSGPLLQGNSLLHKDVVDRPDELIEFTVAKGLQVVTPTYFDGFRTRLFVVTTRGDLLEQQQATRRSYLMSSTSRPSSNAESEKLAFKLHASSHLSARDLEEMCRRAEILSPQLAHYLTLAAHSCLSCMRTARLKLSKKISLSNVNRIFNNSAQVDTFYLDSVDRRLILYAVDTRTKFSMARLCQKRDLELLASTFEREWVHVYGPPAEVSGDQEFSQGYFQDMLHRHNIAFREQGARRHNKTGVVERGNGVLKDFVKRLVSFWTFNLKLLGPQRLSSLSRKLSVRRHILRICLWTTRCFRPSNSVEDTKHPCAAYTDASLPRNVSLHMTRWLHVELCRERAVSGMSMCYHAANCRRELKFCSISRTLSKRTLRGGKLVILLTRATICNNQEK
jgi:hypothetical protein